MCPCPPCGDTWMCQVMIAISYLTPAVSGIPTASERGAKSEVAHKWAKWLPHPCRIGDPHRFRAGGRIRSGPQVGKMATSPLPYRGSPPLQSGGQNQKWPTSGQNGYLTPAVSGIPTASERGAKSEVAHKWAKWLPHPCRIGDPHRFRAGGRSRSGPQVGKMATSPLPYRGSPPLQSGGQNQKWPTSGQNGYLTPAVSGIPTASERGAKSEVAHKWAKWLPHPCRIGDPHRFRAGGKIRSGPQVGKVATSPLPYRGSPPLQSGGQNQKWPTSGQNGYLTPAVSSQKKRKSRIIHFSVSFSHTRLTPKKKRDLRQKKKNKRLTLYTPTWGTPCPASLSWMQMGCRGPRVKSACQRRQGAAPAHRTAIDNGVSWTFTRSQTQIDRPPPQYGLRVPTPRRGMGAVTSGFDLKPA